MRILYHHTAPSPVVPGTEAVVQEVELLRSRFGGEVVSLIPTAQPRTKLQPIYGFHRLGTILRLEQQCDINHIYNSDLYLFPFLRLLRKPIVYTTVSGLQVHRRTPSTRALRRLRGIVVPSRHDLEGLEAQGLGNVRVIRPGIDVDRFEQVPPPDVRDFVLVAGSAPWVEEQFQSKGFEALFRIASAKPWLRLILLWRGHLRDALDKRLGERGLVDRVEVIDEWTDVGRLLARAHAAIVLAARPELIKAYPHSLVEALACGRPVVTSACVPMADYVRETGSGEVADGVDETEVLAAITRLRSDYDRRQGRAAEVGKRDFSHDDLIAAYRDVYETALE